MDKNEIEAFLKQIQATLWSVREELLASMGEINVTLTSEQDDQDPRTLARLRKATLQRLGRLDATLAQVHEQIEQALGDLDQHAPAS